MKTTNIKRRSARINGCRKKRRPAADAIKWFLPTHSTVALSTERNGERLKAACYYERPLEIIAMRPSRLEGVVEAIAEVPRIGEQHLPMRLHDDGAVDVLYVSPLAQGNMAPYFTDRRHAEKLCGMLWTKDARWWRLERA